MALVTLMTIPEEIVKVNTMPNYFRHRGLPESIYYGVYLRLGEVKKGGNEPYCYTEEKQCAGHIVRVLAPSQFITRGMVERDDGTLWVICLEPFNEVYRVYVEKEKENHDGE